MMELPYSFVYIHKPSCTDWVRYSSIRGKYTIAIQEYRDYLKSDEPVKLMRNHLPIKLVIGIARCHPEDQYNKSVGRRIACENLDVKPFFISEYHNTIDEDYSIRTVIIAHNLELNLWLEISYSNKKKYITYKVI